MNYAEYIANSNMSFGGVQFDVALDFAKEAITADPKKLDGKMVSEGDVTTYGSNNIGWKYNRLLYWNW